MNRLLISFIALLFSPGSYGQTFTGTGGNIPDAGLTSTCFNISVSGVGVINGTYGLATVCININHTWDSDLDITLQAPDGTVVTLSSGNGGSGDNYTNTCFTATAATSITTGIAPFSGNYLPEGSLAAVNNGQNANGTWRLCIRDVAIGDVGSLLNWSLTFNNTPATPPVGDNPCNAIPLPVGTSCSFSAFNTNGMTPTTSAPAPGCQYNGYNDIWFQVTVPASGNLSLNSLPGAINDCGMAVYAGLCNSLSLIRCNDDSGTLNMPMMNLSGLSPGSTVYVRFWAYSNTATNFGICATSASNPPSCNSATQAGNTCATATPVCNFLGYCGNTFTYTADAWPALTNLFNTCVGGFIGGATIENDSYISFVASDTTASFNVWVTSSTTGNGLQMMFFEGTCNGPVACKGGYNTIYGSNFPNQITATGLIPGNTYYLLVDGYAGDQCNYTLDPVDGVNILDLTAAPSTTICLGGSVTLTATGGNGNYTWTPSTGLSSTSGISVVASPTTTTTYSVTSGTVSNCNQGTLTRTVTVTVLNALPPPITAPVTYCQGANAVPLVATGSGLLWYTTATGGTGSPTPPIPSTQNVGITTYWVSQSNASCGEGPRASLDVTISPQPAAPVVISPVTYCQGAQSSPLSAQGSGLIWYSGASGGNGSSIVPSPSTANTGTFTFYVSQTVNGCEGPRASITVVVNPPVTPDFTPVGPVCRGTMFVLPSVSNNGISGAWTPNIDTTTTRTYTFTPGNGQCASTATMRVPVRQPSSSQTNVTICSDDLPYSWNNQSFAAAGSYSVMLTNAVGCDSTVNLSLRVKQVTTSNTPLSICSSSLPYVWNGQSYNAAGSYTAILTNSANCDSVTTLTLSLRNPTSSNTPVSICITDLPYAWNGQSYNAAGNYTTILTNAEGCDSVTTLTLSLRNPTSSNTPMSICSTDLPYAWNGQTYNAAGNYTTILTNAEGCDSVTTLTLSLRNPTYSNTPVSICSNDLPYAWNGQSYISAGNYTTILTNAEGCDSVATLTLSLRNPTSSNTPVSICSTDLPYAWNGQSYNAAGNYTTILTNSVGCDSVTTLTLSLRNPTSSNTPVSICSTDLPYTWNGQSYNAAGNYTTILINAEGCDSVTTLTLSLRNPTSRNTPVSICSTDLPYAWNGQSYNAAGNYTTILTNSVGCDSVTTLTLSLRNPTSSNTPVSICSTDLPYAWNGQSYNAAGNYTAILTNAAGCDSVTTLSLSLRNPTSSNTPVSICSTDLPYAWNGQSYNAAGNYTAILTNSIGCDSVTTLTLSLRNPTSSNTLASICSTDLPYAWNGQSYNAAGNYTTILTNSVGCDSITTLTLSLRNPTSSNTPVSICSTDLPYAWNGQSYNAAGNYTAILTNSIGCDSVTTLSLSLRNPTSSNTQASICSTDLPYAWNGQSYNAAGNYTTILTNSVGCDSITTLTLSLRNPTSSNTPVSICSTDLPYAWNGQSYNAAGNYTTILTNSVGCDSVTILTLSLRNPTSSNTPISICSTALPYIWNGQSYSAAGTYTSILTNSVNCDSIATLSLSVRQVSTSITDLTICNNQIPYSWNGQSLNNPGTYTATLTNAAGCDSVATLHFLVNSFTAVNISQRKCAAQLPYLWNGINISAAGTYKDTLTGVSGCDSIITLILGVDSSTSSQTSRSVCSDQLPFSWNGQSYSAAGNYSVVLTNAAGCDSVARLSLSLLLPTVSNSDVSICQDQLPYAWNGQSYPAAGSYTVHLTNAAGCDSSARLNLGVRQATAGNSAITVCPSQLPYSWNGQSLSAAGTYTASLTNAAGCDSTATLVFAVNSYSSSNTGISVCPSQLPYIWNSLSLNAPGVYRDTLTGSTGCDSIANLDFSVKSNTSGTTRRAICFSQLPYLWNGQSYAVAGTYSVTIPNAAGCDSVDNLILSVNNYTSSNTDVTVCSSQLPYSWNGSLYYATGLYSDTLTGSAGCDSIARLNLTVRAGTFTSSSGSSCGNYTWNGITYTMSGTYSYLYNNSNGCPSADTLRLVVNAGNFTAQNIAACGSYVWYGTTYTAGGDYVRNYSNASGCPSADTLHLTINSGTYTSVTRSSCDSYVWNGTAYSSSGNYYFNYTNSSGCPSTDTLHLTVNTGTFSAATQSACQFYAWNGNTYTVSGNYIRNYVNALGCSSADTLHLTVSNGVPIVTNTSVCDRFQWNGNIYTSSGTYIYQYPPGSGCLTADTLHLTVRYGDFTSVNRSACGSYTWNGNVYTTSGVYIRQYQNANGCPSADTLKLRIDPIPPAPVANSPVSYCQYDIAGPLSATGTGQLIWYNTATGGSGSPAAPVPSTSSLSTSFYYVSQIIGNCEGPRTPILVRVSPRPVLGIDRDIHLCFGRTLNLDALYNTNGLTSVWTLNQQVVSNTAAVNTPGIYYLVVTNSAGCKDTARVRLTIQPPIVANAGPDDTTDFMTPYQLDGSGGGSYEWTPGIPLLNNPNIPNPIAVLTETTPFVLMVQDAIGCRDYDTVIIYVRLGDDFYVPNAFTPNGDGLNDYFNPTPLGGILELEYFRIYNRWGQLVFETANIARGWDGNYLGRPQDPDNFVWVLKGRNRRGEYKFLKGNVVLIR